MLMKKGVKIALAAGLPLVLAGATFYGVQMMKETQLKEVQAAEQQVTEKEAEQAALEGQLQEQQETVIEKQNQLAELEQQVVLYQESEEAASPEKFLKQKMLDCYVENQELMLTAQSEILVGLGLETDYLVSYEERDVQGELTDEIQGALMDGFVESLDMGTVGDIIGDTVDETIHALRDELSAKSLYEGIVNGLQNGVTNTVQGKIKDAIGDGLGVDVFGVVDLVEQLTGYEEQIPGYLSSVVSNQMQQDVDQISAILGQDAVVMEDLTRLRSLYADFGVLAEELYEQTDGEVDVRPDYWEFHEAALEGIYEKCQVNQKIIEICSEKLGVSANEE